MKKYVQIDRHNYLADVDPMDQLTLKRLLTSKLSSYSTKRGPYLYYHLRVFSTIRAECELLYAVFQGCILDRPDGWDWTLSRAGTILNIMELLPPENLYEKHPALLEFRQSNDKLLDGTIDRVLKIANR